MRYFEIIGEGTTFFYLLENTKKTFVVEEDGHTYRFNVDVSKHRGIGFLQPMRYFKDGYP